MTVAHRPGAEVAAEVDVTGADQDHHVDVGRTVAALSVEAQVAVEGPALTLLQEEAVAEGAVVGLAREASECVKPRRETKR